MVMLGYILSVSLYLKYLLLIMCLCVHVSVRYLQKPEDGAGSLRARVNK